MAQLFVSRTIDGIANVDQSVGSTIGYYSSTQGFAELQSNTVQRIGFLWENQHTRMPFGTTPLTISEQSPFFYFTQEMYTYLGSYQSITVDLITCGLDPILISEINTVSTSLPSITFNFMITDTCGSVGSNWVMKKSILNGVTTSTTLDVTAIYLKPATPAPTLRLGPDADYSVVVRDNDIYACGANTYGQLGFGTTISCSEFTKMPGIPAGKIIKQVSCGNSHTMVLTTDGMVYSCGLNTRGQLAQGTVCQSQPSLAKTLITNVKQIASGHSHTLFLLNDGSVYGCGNNSYGQLGRGGCDDNANPVPVLIPTPTQCSQIACADYSSVLLMIDGSICACGLNDRYQLGDGTATNRNSAATPITFASPFPQSVKQIACGQKHTMFLVSGNQLYGCGHGYYGRLGDNNGLIGNMAQSPKQITPPNCQSQTIGFIKNVYCGRDYTLFLMTDGTAYGCGRNDKGQLGCGTTNDCYLPVQMMIQSMANTIKQIAVSKTHTLISMEGDENSNLLYACGSNNMGQCGVVCDTVPHSSPCSVPIKAAGYNLNLMNNCLYISPDDMMYFTYSKMLAEGRRIKSIECTLTTNLDAETCRVCNIENKISCEIERSLCAEKSLSDQISHLSACINNETCRSSDAEKAICESLNAEVCRATASETTISNNLKNEICRATSAETSITNALNAEICRATASETTMSNNLNNEITRATCVENTISNGMGAEITRTINTEITKAITCVNNAITAEVARATRAESTLTNTINNEIYRAMAAETSLTNSQPNLMNDSDDCTNDSNDTGSQEHLKQMYQRLHEKLNDEIARAKAAEDVLTIGLADEAVRTDKAISASSATLIASVNGAMQVLSGNLSSEVSRAKSSEMALQSGIAKLWRKEQNNF